MLVRVTRREEKDSERKFATNLLGPVISLTDDARDISRRSSPIIITDYYSLLLIRPWITGQ